MLPYVVLQMAVLNAHSFTDVKLTELLGMIGDPGTYLSQHRANTFNHNMSDVS